MKNENCNSRSALQKIFTLLAFLLGVILYIILKQDRNSKATEDERKNEIVPRTKRLPKNVIKDDKAVIDIEEIKLSERQEKVVRVLLEKGKLYPSELQDILSDVSPRTVRRDMTDLEKKGLVEQKGTTKSTYYVYIGE
jgi:predicted HTH transcriptional regulator